MFLFKKKIVKNRVDAKLDLTSNYLVDRFFN